MSVKLREKNLKGGKISLYLDIYKDGKREYRFLGLKLTKGTRPEERDADRRTMELARKAALQAEYDINVRGLGFGAERKASGDLTAFVQDAAARRKADMYTAIAKKVARHTGGARLDLARLDQKWLQGFQTFLLGSGLSNNVARQYMINLGTLLEDAVADGLIASNPVRSIPKSRRLRVQELQRSFLTLGEVEALAGADSKVPVTVRQAFLFSCFTGLRISDVFRLEWRMVFRMEGREGTGWRMAFRQKKTKAAEVVPLSAQAASFVQSMWEWAQGSGADISPGGRVFPYSNGSEKVRHAAANRWLRIWAKEAGIAKYLHFHMARHTFATLTLAYGADIYTVSKLLGHRDISTTMIYAKVVDRLKDEAVARLPLIGGGGI